MAISETKMQIVIANYFKDECDVNTSIRQAFEKGFRIGVKKGVSMNRPKGEWIDIGGYEVCKNCHEVKRFPHWNFCPNCGSRNRKENE